MDRTEEELMVQAKKLQASARYSIFRSRPFSRDGESLDELVEAGLSLAEARAKADKLSVSWRQANPGKTSWSSDLFILRSEDGEEINRLFAQARVERSKELA